MSTTSKFNELSDHFAELEGRRPRLLLCSLSTTEESEKALRIYAACFADAGYDVDISPRGQSAASCAKMAAENDVHLLGVYSTAGITQDSVDDLRRALAEQGRDDIILFSRAAEPSQLDGIAYHFHDSSMEADVGMLLEQLINWIE